MLVHWLPLGRVRVQVVLPWLPRASALAAAQPGPCASGFPVSVPWFSSGSPVVLPWCSRFASPLASPLASFLASPLASPCRCWGSLCAGVIDEFGFFQRALGPVIESGEWVWGLGLGLGL